MRMYLALALALASCKTDKPDKPAPAPTAPAPVATREPPAIPTEGVPPGTTDQAAPAKPVDVPKAALEPKAIDSGVARDLIDKGAAVVLDVRTPDEFSQDHLDTAVNIPVQDFSKRIAEVDKLTGGDKRKPIVVYCAAGARAAKAKEQLDAAGYKVVVNGGGLDDLQQ
jgi:phage shock protein E